MCDHTLHCGRSYSCRYYLQTFDTEEIFKLHIKIHFKINEKQKIMMP